MPYSFQTHTSSLKIPEFSSTIIGVAALMAVTAEVAFYTKKTEKIIMQS